MKGLIFDLDNCLAPADEMGRDFYAPVYDAIRAANQGAVSESELAAAFEECWRTPFDKVARDHGFTAEMRAAGWARFIDLETTEPMNGYGDLEALGRIGLPLVLVTSGFKRLQWSKIRALGLERWLDELIVDAIDEEGGKGKQPLFERVCVERNWRADEVMAVGDSAAAEIAAGNRLGMTTVQTLRPGVPRAEEADHHIESLFELEELIHRVAS